MRRRQFLSTVGSAAVGSRIAATLAGGSNPGTAGRLFAAGADDRPMRILLWCWDARMTWDDEPDRVSGGMAVSEQLFPYRKSPGMFQQGFRRMIDYCARVGIEGIIIWGFLRDSHGGTPAAVDLCKYASDKGIAIIPGVGVCAYGGFYYDGKSPYNIGTYLAGHPDRAGVARLNGTGREVRPVLDPSLEANRRWWREGLEWMLDTFEIGGINFEMGDFIVNASAEAAAARAAVGIDADENILETVVATRDLLDRAFQIKPEGLFINSTYRGYHAIRGFPALPYPAVVHPRTIWQYSMGQTVKRDDFPAAFTGATPHRGYAYLHWFNASTKTAARDYSGDIGRVYPALRSLGFEFGGSYGEISAIDDPVADANYRTQVAFARTAG
jgi:hypothetical protein